MTALADMDGAPRRPGLAPLDRARLLAARKQIFDPLQDAWPEPDSAHPTIPSLPDGPEGEE